MKRLSDYFNVTPLKFFQDNRRDLCSQVTGCTSGGGGGTIAPNLLIAATDASGNVIDGTANVISRTLNGFVATNATIVAGDTILAALGKAQGQLTIKANLASPTFTGTPLSTTAAPGTNTTQIATTAFVTAAVAAIPTPFDSFQRLTVTTTNATPTTIITVPTVSNTVYTLQTRVVARNTTNNTDVASMNVATLIVNTAGTLTKVGDAPLFTPISSIALATADISYAISGTNILIQVTGVAATNLTWEALVTIINT